MSKSDGSSADYYKLPSDSTELQHLISYKNMNSQIGEIFRSCYRFGEASHSDQLRDAKKILFYAEAEIERLTKCKTNNVENVDNLSFSTDNDALPHGGFATEAIRRRHVIQMFDEFLCEEEVIGSYGWAKNFKLDGLKSSEFVKKGGPMLGIVFASRWDEINKSWLALLEGVGEL